MKTPIDIEFVSTVAMWITTAAAGLGVLLLTLYFLATSHEATMRRIELCPCGVPAVIR